MNAILEELLTRWEMQIPPITHEEFEQHIAQCVGKEINGIIQQYITGEPLKIFQKIAQERFSLLCEIIPALSLFVSVRDESAGQQMDEKSFSSMTLDQSLQMILDNKKTAASATEITTWTRDAMNLACQHFLNAMIITHPLLLKIFQYIQDEYSQKIHIATRSPMQLIMESMPDTPASERPGMYL